MDTLHQPEPRTDIGSAELANASLGSRPSAVEVSAPRAAEEVSRRLFETEREFRVAVAQIATHPGRIARNTDKIIDYIGRAREAGAKLVVFPELTIPGYGSMDLFFNERYVAENLAALQRIRAATAGMTVIVGFVEPDPAARRPDGRPVLYNAAAVMHDGRIVDIRHKSLLPTYEIFDEERYFAPARERKVIEVGGIRLGTEICEDLWAEGYPIDPTAELARGGAELIVNLSASPFQLGKLPVRAGLVERASRGHGVPFIYANLVGGYDGYEAEVLFDGRSMVMTREGKLAALGRGFEEDLVVVDINRPQELSLPEISETAELKDALVMGIRDYFSRRSRITGGPIPKAFIGLSGGIDSAVVAALCVEALGADKVVGITMPSRFNSEETRNDAYRLAENLGIECRTVPIEREIDAVLSTLRDDPEFAAAPKNVTEENVQARLRMLNLMAYANKLGGMMVNTGNKTELILNNCTIYGDMTGGFSVLGDVDKDRVYALARYVNARAGRELIPETTIDRVPSAELADNQSDADVMGAHPAQIAPLAREIFERQLSFAEARAEFGGRYPEALIERVFRRMDDFEWKSRQMPPALRVTPHAYGIGRRMPMNHGYYE